MYYWNLDDNNSKSEIKICNGCFDTTNLAKNRNICFKCYKSNETGYLS